MGAVGKGGTHQIGAGAAISVHGNGGEHLPSARAGGLPGALLARHEVMGVPARRGHLRSPLLNWLLPQRGAGKPARVGAFVRPSAGAVLVGPLVPRWR